MDFFTIIGLGAGVFVLIQGILQNGSLSSFYDVGSIYITIGGTVCALLMSFPLGSLKNVFPAVAKAFLSKKQNPLKTIDNIFELAEQARRGGMLSLEEKVNEYKDDFLKHSVMTILDSHDPSKVRESLEAELVFIQERHASVQSILEKGAAYGPAFGMIGTLIGLINMLKMLDDPDSLGPNMSIALVTTFYGSVLANVFFLPLAGKLKVMDEEEMLCKQLIVEGILAIQTGENPRLIKEKLSSFLPKKALKQKVPKAKDKAQKAEEAAQ